MTTILAFLNDTYDKRSLKNSFVGRYYSKKESLETLKGQRFGEKCELSLLDIETGGIVEYEWKSTYDYKSNRKVDEDGVALSASSSNVNIWTHGWNSLSTHYLKHSYKKDADWFEIQWESNSRRFGSDNNILYDAGYWSEVR